MKPLNVIYKNGNLYESESDKLISFPNETELVLVVSKPQDIKFEEVNSQILKPLNSEQKLQEVTGKSDQCKKIAKAGDLLYFYIKVDEDKKRLVTVTLLEDLYLFLKKSWKDQTADLFSCICEVSTIEGIKLKEPFKSASLSDLYKKVYVHYNLNKGNPARNAFNEYLISPKDKKKNLSWVRKQTKLQ